MWAAIVDCLGDDFFAGTEFSGNEEVWYVGEGSVVDQGSKAVGRLAFSDQWVGVDDAWRVVALALAISVEPRFFDGFGDRGLEFLGFERFLQEVEGSVS